jgi:Flp pilus assembly protein TadD
MVLTKKKVLPLLFIAPLFLAGCGSLPVNSTHGDEPNNSDHLLNLLDPTVTSEEQAFAKGEAALLEGKSENALFYFVKTLQYNKNNIKALEKIASIHERGKHPEVAIKVYHDILAVDQTHALANEKLGLYYLGKGQDGKAKPCLLQAVKIDKKRWKAYNGLGVIADLERNTEEAINYYQSALAIMPNSPMLLNNLGYSYYLSGDELKARGLFTQALNYDTQYKRAIHNLALIEIKNGEFTSAAMLFNRIMSPHESYNNIGYIALLNGQYDIAEEYLKRAIEESPVYFPKAQENLKNLMAARATSTPYRPTAEEMQQTAPAPEVESESDTPEPDSDPGPAASKKPAPNNPRLAQTAKPAVQKTRPAAAIKPIDKKGTQNHITKAQRVAAQPAKKKTQPETERITGAKVVRSEGARPQDTAGRAPAPVAAEPASVSAPAVVEPAEQTSKPEPAPAQTLSKPEENKTGTPEPARQVRSQTVEDKQPAVIAERPVSPPLPVAVPTPEESPRVPEKPKAEAAEKPKTLPPLAPADSLNKNPVFVTDIGVGE